MQIFQNSPPQLVGREQKVMTQSVALKIGGRFFQRSDGTNQPTQDKKATADGSECPEPSWAADRK